MIRLQYKSGQWFERRTMSPAKSRPSSRVARGHCMPLWCFPVSSASIQLIASRNEKIDRKYPWPTPFRIKHFQENPVVIDSAGAFPIGLLHTWCIIEFSFLSQPPTCSIFLMFRLTILLASKYLFWAAAFLALVLLEFNSSFNFFLGFYPLESNLYACIYRSKSLFRLPS